MYIKIAIPTNKIRPVARCTIDVKAGRGKLNCDKSRFTGRLSFTAHLLSLKLAGIIYTESIKNLMAHLLLCNLLELNAPIMTLTNITQLT
jgi:hypothetical protein